MEKQKTRSHPVILLLVILLGMSVLVYQTAHSFVQDALVASGQVDDSTKSDSQNSQEVIIASQDVFLSVSTIQVDQVYHQIKEIVFGDDKKEKDTHIITKYVSSFFKTLFQQVISPNAP
ncbi:MAG: hypothetical protein L3J29_09180 [Cyclobacteriaceae bacterium]|nr:hypothetical protein [Cyclobacteriaceae bacterium]